MSGGGVGAILAMAAVGRLTQLVDNRALIAGGLLTRCRYASLTPRERDVLARIAAGLLNKQITAELDTTPATVKEQRAHVMAKMQAGSVAELVRFASRLGITLAGSGSNPPQVG